ncbi:HTH araC/xylS-type domain-containing protein [Hyphomicrobiales bacterium]|nr:HTH araC/xylS-type domain-containing protein [Hyphomicrobiales bacterium]CAH1700508.1 HTH araC/xylS-type domain-containing protein [Hyphomicrobiales bacterium]CAI0344357.1 AraC family transcriptional regulator, positive regulator of tynA and feaB [Hyphomicrobiales bacterium]
MMEISTDGLRRNDRLDFWSQTVLKRMAIDRRDEEAHAFHATLRRVAGNAGEFWDHFSTAIHVERSERRCRADSGAEIYVGLVLDGRSEVSFGDRRVRLVPGDVYVTDFSRPVRAHWLKHRELGVMFTRGAGPQDVGRLAPAGAVRLLSSHLRTLADEATDLSQDERSSAVDIAIQFARLALAGGNPRDGQDNPSTLLAAARQLIARHCTDPELSAAFLATFLGCSRASLYRAFESEPESVAAAIWTARLQHARKLLLTDRAATIGSIAFRSGFLDQANFNRMFRREFALSPGEFRHANGMASERSGRL